MRETKALKLEVWVKKDFHSPTCGPSAFPIFAFNQQKVAFKTLQKEQKSAAKVAVFVFFYSLINVNVWELCFYFVF